jgi:hypothetical protein
MGKVIMRPEERLYYNATKGRAVAEVPFGIACYQRADVGKSVYTHCGVVGTPEDAQRWLEGEQPERLVKVF